MKNIKINFSLEALRAKRAELARIQLREYETRGNTQRCQELWEKITKLDEEIARRESEFGTESIKELARKYHLEECYDTASNSIMFSDDYFQSIDIFVIDLLKNEHDFRLSCDADRIWHLERI